MKQHYEIGAVLRFNGKNYEVVEGNGNTIYGTCTECAFYGGKPGTCKLSETPDLFGSCASTSRPDGRDIHYVLTDKTPNVFYGFKSEPVKDDVEPVSVEEKGCQTEIAFNEQPEAVQEVQDTTTLVPEPQQKTATAPKLNVAKARLNSGKVVEGIVVTGEDGSKYVMPYGSKVLMDGSCNIIPVEEKELSFQTPYVDMNGTRIYTGDRLNVVSFGDWKHKYWINTVVVEKKGVVPLFYNDGTDEHSNDVVVADGMVINGYIIEEDTVQKHVLDWYSSVMDAMSKTIGNGVELGTEEYKAIYKMYLVNEHLKIINHSYNGCN